MRWTMLAGLGLLVIGGLGALYVMLEGETPDTGPRVTVPLPPLRSTPALLLPAPDPGMVENSNDGPLPKIGRDGHQSWQVYARGFDANDKRPRVALVMTGLGLDRALSQTAMDRLAGAVTLGFDPYTPDLKEAMNQARSLGHEVLLGLPLEPLDYPRQDPGPLTLLVSLGDAVNGARLNKVMAAGVGYVGLVALWGERFTSEKSALLPMLETLKQRGLMYVDNKPPSDNATVSLASQLRLPWAAAIRALDIDAEPAAIDQALGELETVAKRDGATLGIAALSPASVDRVAAWTATLEAKGIALAPASAVANRQAIPRTAMP